MYFKDIENEKDMKRKNELSKAITIVENLLDDEKNEPLATYVESDLENALKHLSKAIMDYDARINN